MKGDKRSAWRKVLKTMLYTHFCVAGGGEREWSFWVRRIMKVDLLAINGDLLNSNCRCFVHGF